MPTLRGHIYDAGTGATLQARVHVLEEYRKVPGATGRAAEGRWWAAVFYSDGSFRARPALRTADVVVERGTEYRPLLRTVEIPRSGTLEVELPLERWINLPAEGWHAGNTHIHYDDHETGPTSGAGSIHISPTSRSRSSAPSSGASFPMPATSTSWVAPPARRPPWPPAPSLDIGEETRHNRPANGAADGGIGYGHLMLINLAKLVEPLSRARCSRRATDYPPLIDAADEAHRQGGVAIWCHNGQGMEAPVAASLGKLDAFNLFDPFWMDPEWDVWYDLLTCGLQLPASTGSDWFICSSNRVYAFTGDGSAADLALDAGPSHAGTMVARAATTTDRAPVDSCRRRSATALGWRRSRPGARSSPTARPFSARSRSRPWRRTATPTERSGRRVRWQSAQPVHRVEIVADGEVVAREAWESGRSEGTMRRKVTCAIECGWRRVLRRWPRLLRPLCLGTHQPGLLPPRLRRRRLPANAPGSGRLCAAPRCSYRVGANAGALPREHPPRPHDRPLQGGRDYFAGKAG